MNNKIFNENGHITEYGKETLDQILGKELDVLMNSAESVQELQTLKAVFAKYMGDKISERIAKISEAEPLDAMGDGKFLSYMMKKHGAGCFQTGYMGMSPREMARFDKIVFAIRESIQSAMNAAEFVKPVYPHWGFDRKVF